MKRKVAVFTGNRAEYGMQYPILRAIEKAGCIDHFLLVSGAHLDEDFGQTSREIAKDGFRIYQEVALRMSRDSLFGTAQAIGSGVLSVSEALKELRPDLLLVYADRFESFAALIAGTQMGIPTAHVEGGDLTEGGALDDSVRHSMTKLAHLHFTTNAEATRRILSLGEEPWRVFEVGLPALDLIAEGLFASPDEIAKTYQLDLSNPLVVFTQHSVATEHEKADFQIKESLAALEILSQKKCQIIVTYPNNDAGGKRIMRAIEQWSQKNRSGVQVHKSVGRYVYHGLLNVCGRVGRGVCVGNSSSGIKETPALGCPSVNIGDRQKGRLRGNNVIDVKYECDKIVSAVYRGLHDEEFRERCRTGANPYGKGGAGEKITDVLARIPLDERLIKKKLTY